MASALLIPPPHWSAPWNIPRDIETTGKMTAAPSGNSSASKVNYEPSVGPTGTAGTTTTALTVDNRKTDTLLPTKSQKDIQVRCWLIFAFFDFQFKISALLWNFDCTLIKYTRVTLKLLTLPARTKTENFFINLGFSYFKLLTVGVQSFFRPFESRPEERKKVHRTPSSPSLRVKTAIPCMLSFNCENREE